MFVIECYDVQMVLIGCFGVQQSCINKCKFGLDTIVDTNHNDLVINVLVLVCSVLINNNSIIKLYILNVNMCSIHPCPVCFHNCLDIPYLL